VEKLVITVAPTGSVPTKLQNPHLPLTSQEIAETAYRCYNEGASIVHVHAREDGRPTLDAEVFAQTHRLISQRCDMIVQISTGGRAGTDPVARAAAVSLIKPEMASLTTGSVNFPDRVYENSFETIEYLARAMQKVDTKPEMEIFDASMINNALRLVRQDLASEPLHFNFVLGLLGAQPAMAKILLHLTELIPTNATWTVSGIGRHQLPMAVLALVMGGHVRVGLEDNLHYRPGELASNEQLVARVVRLARELGRDVASPAETRRILGLYRNNGN
jgi:3-keto-5-aminohexanoate cleavage enzyme